MDILQKSSSSLQKSYGIITIEILWKSSSNHHQLYRHPIEILHKSLSLLQNPYGNHHRNNHHHHRRPMEILWKSSSSLQKSNANSIKKTSPLLKKSYGHPIAIIIITPKTHIEMLQQTLASLQKSYGHHVEIITYRNHHHHCRTLVDFLQKSSSSSLQTSYQNPLDIIIIITLEILRTSYRNLHHHYRNLIHIIYIHLSHQRNTMAIIQNHHPHYRNLFRILQKSSSSLQSSYGHPIDIIIIIVAISLNLYRNRHHQQQSYGYRVESSSSPQKTFRNPSEIIIIVTIEILWTSYRHHHHHLRHVLDILQTLSSSLKQSYGHPIDTIVITIGSIWK